MPLPSYYLGTGTGESLVSEENQGQPGAAAPLELEHRNEEHRNVDAGAAPAAALQRARHGARRHPRSARPAYDASP